MTRARVLAAVGAVAAALAAAPARADVGGAEIVAFLNAQRAAHGIPAGIVEDPALSSGCALHNAYGAFNNVLGHEENPALPGYTAAGDQAGRTSVLYSGGGPWTATSNPFETAPIHLHQLLAPRIDRMGASENQGYGCATTLASRERPAPAADAAYTYPGEGATGWRPSQVARESPYTPGELIGIPAGASTGPYLYVMFDGPDLTVFDRATVTGATLAGPDGPVDVAAVDNATPGLAGYLPTGVELIPRAPLRPRSTYVASISANVSTQGGQGPARAFARTWSFATGLLDNAVSITSTSATGRVVRVAVRSDAPEATVVATGPGTTTTAPVAGQAATLRLDADGAWQICADSGGGATDYLPARDCVTTDVYEPPVAQPPRRAFTVSVPARVRRGQRIKLVVTSRARFRLRFRVYVKGGRTLRRFAERSLASGSWTFPLSTPRRYNRPGRKVHITVIATTQGRTYTVRKLTRFT